MTTSLPRHSLMTTFLNDRLRKRKITVEHLADLLQPISEASVRCWLAGWSAPLPGELNRLAGALQVDPVELLAGWLIDNSVVSERTIRLAVLDPLKSDFPRSDAWDLIAPRKCPDMDVGDPHDDREPSKFVRRLRTSGTKV